MNIVKYFAFFLRLPEFRPPGQNFGKRVFTRSILLALRTKKKKVLQVVLFVLQAAPALTKTQCFLDQIAHISAYGKARTSHESSPKSSDSDFKDDLNSFQNCLMLAPVTVQSSRCPPSHSFSRMFQNLIKGGRCSPTRLAQ